MRTFVKERSFFLGRLRVDPAFFIRHTASLSGAVVRKISNRLRVRFASRHCGAKRTPRWMKDVPDQVGSQAKGVAGLVLPLYPAAKTAGLVKSAVNSERSQDDPEAYFELNRWGFLLESLLVDTGDWHGDLAKVSVWIEAHTDKEDAAWEAYSASERVSNLLVYLSVTSAITETPEFKQEVLNFVADSAEWIRRHIEYYGPSATNNHILNNARALVLAGVSIKSESVCQAGMQTFRECLPIMVGEGGFLRERSSHYQLVVASWVLDAWRFVDANYGAGHPDTEYLRGFGQRMISAAAMLCGTDGRLLGLVGDISPDTSPLYSTLRLSRLYPEFWPVKDMNLSSPEIRDGWFRISEPDQQVLGNFPPGLFPPVFPTHGHCDLTSFVWLSEGVEILADSGRYRYTSDEVSSLQKSALGHNVPLVDGYSPLCESLVANGLWWPRPYAVALLEYSVLDGAVVLSHDGFARATNVTRHSRKIRTMEGGIEVIDSFDGKGCAEIGLRWNFGACFKEFDSDLMSASGQDGTVQFVTLGFTKPPCIGTGSGHPDGGWISPRYGEVEPSISADVVGEVILPAVISTRFKYKKCAA